MKRIALPVLVAASLLVAAPVRADPTAEDRAAADALYDEAGKLMAQKRWADACPKLEASQKLDPGIGTLLRLGYCYENEGKTASAWSAFNDTEGMARKANDRRADDAAKQAKLLAPKLARLLLDVAPENRGAGLEIRRDGRALDAAMWSTPLPIDPGEHTVEAARPGKLPWKTTVTIEAKPGVTTVQVPALADAPVVVQPAPEAVAAPPFWGPLRIAGVAVGSVGVVGVVIGAITGAMSLSQMSDLKSKCPSYPIGCPSSLKNEWDTAGVLGNVSTAAFVIGGVGVATGGVLFGMRWPQAPPKSTQSGVTWGVGLGIGRLDVEGRF
jgi:hypothetical protein